MKAICLTVVASCLASTAYAMPTVNGNTINWPDDGWYQVQDSTSYAVLCEGTRFCEVPAGTYIVINHTTGERFSGTQVGSVTTPSEITVSATTINWPDDGWYQVQDASTYQSICNGGRSCTVDSAGEYIVINHSTAVRSSVTVEGETPNTGIAVPANVTIAHYSDTIAELLWDAPAAGQNIVSTEVFRDGVSIGITQGNSFYDDTRTQYVAHQYQLIATNSNGEQSSPAELAFTPEQQTLATGDPSVAISYYTEQSVLLDGNTAVVVADQEDTVNGTGAIYLFNRDAAGAWQQTQRLTSITSEFTRDFGETIALDNNTMLIVEDTGDFDQMHVYAKDTSNYWSNTQTLQLGVDIDGISLKSQIALDGDTFMVGANNNNRPQSGVFVFQRDAAGVWNEKTNLAEAVRVFESAAGGVDCSAQLFGNIVIDADIAVVSSISRAQTTACEDNTAFVFERVANDEWQVASVIEHSFGTFSISNGAIYGVRSRDVVNNTISADVVEYTQSAAGEWLLNQTIDLNLKIAEFTYRGQLALAVDNNKMLIGASIEDGRTVQSGVAYYYQRQASGEWTLSDTFSPVDSTSQYHFGQSVALDGDDALIGASNWSLNVVRGTPAPRAAPYYYYSLSP